MDLFDLPPEIILEIVHFLLQTDLLNISLVCKHLRSVTEPELFREYTNARENKRSFKPFIVRLLDRPELAR